jgi:hypothetical protein
VVVQRYAITIAQEREDRDASALGLVWRWTQASGENFGFFWRPSATGGRKLSLRVVIIDFAQRREI